jgi:hypothetical protein
MISVSKGIKLIRGILIFSLILLLPSGSCNNKCETCRKYDNRTGQLTDERTACDPAMISNLESKGYYCR